MVRRIEIDLDERVDTGAVQFGDEWPGVFVRGDDCMVLVGILRFHLKHSHPGSITERALAGRLRSDCKDAIGGWQPPADPAPGARGGEGERE